MMTITNEGWYNHPVPRENLKTADDVGCPFEGGNQLRNDGSVSWYNASDVKFRFSYFSDFYF